MIKHRHHIIPRYMGGTDDPSNIVYLTVKQHAEAHRILYKKYGNWQDRLAWQGLLGIIPKEDIVREAQRKAGIRCGKMITSTEKHKIATRKVGLLPASKKSKEMARITMEKTNNKRYSKIKSFNPKTEKARLKFIFDNFVKTPSCSQCVRQ